MLDYGGFYIDRPVGNNAFSYQERINKRIYVPKLVEARIDQVELGGPASFIEVEDGQELECFGMKNMYRLVDRDILDLGKEVYLFDNHNHAFFFWCQALNRGLMERGQVLLHVDQHKDTRIPPDYHVDIGSLEDVKRYTNEVLNVGSFIKPALHYGIFSDLMIVDSTYSMDMEYPESYVLDIDLDFFSRDMDYIDYDLKINRVKEYIKGSSLITIATSPYFIEQERALKALKDLFDK
nr:UPF0489 family protein [uncultured Peptostreptococcus sp.]